MVMMQGNLHGQRRNLFAKATSLAHSNVTQCLGRFMGIIDHNPSLFVCLFFFFFFGLLSSSSKSKWLHVVNLSAFLYQFEVYSIDSSTMIDNHPR